MKTAIMHQAMLNEINFSFLISAIIAILALVLAFFIKRALPAKEDAVVKAEQ